MLVNKDGKILVLDSRSLGLYWMDNKGKILFNYSNRKGKGPGETDSYFDVTWDMQNEKIYLLGPLKLIQLNEKLQYIDERSLPIFGYAIQYFSQNCFLYNVLGFDKDNIILAFNWLTNELKSVKPRPKNLGRIGGKPNVQLGYFGSEPYACLYFVDTVYSFNGTIAPKYRYDFGNYQLDPKTIFTQTQDNYEMSQVFVNTGKAYRYDNFREQEDFIYFSFSMNNNRVYNSVISKKTGHNLFTGYFVDGNKSIVDLNTVGSDNSSLIVQWNIIDLKEYIKTLDLSKLRIEWREFYNSCNSIDENLNPVLMFLDIN